MATQPISNCLLQPRPETRLFQPLAEDILSDEELLDLFRIIKQIIRGRPDAERIAKVVFCIFYSLGDHVKCYRPVHDDTILFRDDLNPGTPLSAVRVSHNPSCCGTLPTLPPSQYQHQEQSQDTAISATDESDQIYTLGQHWKDLAQQSGTALNSIATNNDSSAQISADLHHHQSIADMQNSISTSSSSASSTTASTAATQSTMNNASLTPYLSSATTPMSSSSAIMLLDHTLSNATTSNTSSSSDHSTSIRPYNDFRPIFSMNSPSQSFSVPLRFGERRDALPPDYTQQLAQNDNYSSTMAPLPQLDTYCSTSPLSTTASTLSEAPEYQQLNSMLHGHMTNTRIQVDPSTDRLMEPRQRGFYYQYGRIDREPPLLRRFAEQGVLTQASLLRKRKRQCSDTENPYVLSTLPAPVKRPKVPHRNGEFDQRRNDILHRLRSITLADLELKSLRLAPDTTLSIEHADLPSTLQISSMSPEDAAELLEPALRILTFHSNMKPHLDNGMNQNGIYYNGDYYRLYLAFVQFQKVFATLFPQDVVKVRTLSSRTRNGGDDNYNTNDDDDDDEYDPLAIPLPPSYHAPHVSAMSERDRDRDRNMNMKAYRGWIEPLLTETNWAAFRRNIVVGERMVLLTKVVGQGVLLMTKELSGSKLHLTFTNSEWDEFIGGLHVGKWDDTVSWDDGNDDDKNNKKVFWGDDQSRLVDELKNKFLSDFWFSEVGTPVPPHLRKHAQEQRNQEREEAIQRQQQEHRVLTNGSTTIPSSNGDDDRATHPSPSPSSPFSSTTDSGPTTSTSMTANDSATAGQIALSSTLLLGSTENP
ncbi:hypothetical protein BCR42DRAFT_421546 [Absidia repens]|uniref:Uncharacterized protein n=1 Tax=Absidia repens TaxID=90262 RepID=A0A1X2I7H0_9FUNG|nr:hypothetical protein BCR42DRAFT_421546 [Absidia repens]